MNTKNIAFFLVFSVVLGFSAPIVSAAEEEDNGRYFIATTKGFWKGTFGARHNFEDGFTANLSDWQLKIAKIAGVEVYPVKKLSILPGESFLGRFRSQPRITPSSQLPWGVELVYGNTPFDSSAGEELSIAVLDTGIFKDHTDLKSRVSDCKDFTNNKQAIVDGKCEDKNGHGTHVAGIIAADGGSDSKGIYGVAPKASLMAYKVCGNSGSCWSDDIAAALYAAADNGANIVNLSLGSDSSSSLIKDAIDYAIDKGVLVVAAGGNDGPYADSIDYPAAFSSVIAVGAIDSNKIISSWSSRGTNSASTPYVVQDKDMEFAAPGVNIESTWKDGGYAVLSGTSMAAPHVAGLAAKIWDTDATTTRQLLQTIFEDIDALGDDNASGFGLPTLQ